MEISFTNDGLIGIALLFGVIVLLYLMVREIRLMRTNNRKLELEIEREKINILRQDQHKREPSLLDLNDQQLISMREIEDINGELDKTVFVKQKVVQGRIQKLENMVKNEKLDRMLVKIQNEEKKIV